MKLSKIGFGAAIAFSIGLTNANLTHGQAQQASSQKKLQTQDGQNHDGHDHGDHDHSQESIAYLLPQWKSMHFEDATKAKQHAETVTKIGCEVKQDSHAGHIDVTYRCVEWKSMKVATHALAEQWTGWLKGSGFDVSQGHCDASFTEGKEAVEFRLTKWKSIHGDGTPQEKQFTDTLKKIGCEVVIDKHAGHSDIKFRAPTWRDIHVADHSAADQMQAWLTKNGFEVAPHKH